MSINFHIERVNTTDGYQAIQKLQRIVWNTDDSEVVPDHMMRTAHNYGGLVLGAYDEAGQMVGFVFGFIGCTNDPTRIQLNQSSFIHCSHMMGIHPDYQKQGVGTALKQAQREAIIEMGYHLAVWTYDPLLGHNARLNIEKLGGICRHYKEDVYGSLTGINEGLPTDRFEVEWWVTGQRVHSYLKGSTPVFTLNQWLNAGVIRVNPSQPWRDKLRQPGPTQLNLSGNPLLLEIPGDFDAVRATDMELAREWRMTVRDICQQAFQKDYVVARFISDVTNSERRNYYLLLNKKYVEPFKEQE